MLAEWREGDGWASQGERMFGNLNIYSVKRIRRGKDHCLTLKIIGFNMQISIHKFIHESS